MSGETSDFQGLYGTLILERAAAQHEMKLLRGDMEAIESERQVRMRNLVDRSAKVETDLQEAEALKMDLQQARDVQELFFTRQGLVSKVLDLTQDIRKTHADQYCRLRWKANMGTKGRIPPHHLRHTLPGPGIGHPDPFAPGLWPPRGVFPLFFMMPPEVMEQKLAAQHADMHKLSAENQSLAATRGKLRQELAAAQHELQMLCGHMGAMEYEREQRIRGLVKIIGKMEADLQDAEPLKIELQKAQTDAQDILSARQGLVAQMKDLTQYLQKPHADMQQFHGVMSELEKLRQEFKQCRATYDFDKKLYTEHLESLQAMEKNYMPMAREVEKLRAALSNATIIDRSSDRSYGGPTDENDTIGHFPVAHNPYDNYGIQQGCGPLPGGTGLLSGGSGPLPGGSGGGGSGSIAAATSASEGAPRAAGGIPSHDKSGTAHADDKSGTAAGFDAQRGSVDIQRGHVYDAQSQRGAGFNTQRGPGYDSYELQGGSSYDAQRGPGYDDHG